MNTNTNTNSNANNNVNVNELLNSREFENIVGKIASTHGFTKYSNPMLYDDMRQACAIAVLDCASKYDADLVGGNFWGYAYQRIAEYAKNEVHEQRNLIHIPYNRRVDSKRYSRITHEYTGMTHPDGHTKDDLMMGNTNGEAEENIDLKNALNTLNADERTVFEMKLGMAGENDTFSGISEELGISLVKARKLYESAVSKMRAYLA